MILDLKSRKLLFVAAAMISALAFSLLCSKEQLEVFQEVVLC